jgi:cystathionine beta-lyase
LPRHVRGGLGSLGQAATVAAWREGQPWLDAVLAYLDGNRQRVARFVASGCRAFAVVPEATFLAWPIAVTGTVARSSFRDRARLRMASSARSGPRA